MSAELFPEPGESEGSGLPGDGQYEEEEEGPGQGLYVTLPAEELTLEGFAEAGRADTMAPGSLLAMILDVIAGDEGEGLAGLSDDQLIGFLSGTRRMESRIAWAQMAAIKEFASRPRRKGFAADEIADAFNLTWLSAAGDISYATTVARRLPRTFAALAAGKIHPVKVKIIEESTSILSDEDAAKADAELAEVAQSLTYGKLRAAASKLVLKLDPEAVRKRKERAKREVNVRHFREESGNAGITGREMPSVEVLASMQHVEDRARALRAAGVPGTWEALKARALLDLLQERDTRMTLGDSAQDDGASAGAQPGTADGESPASAHPGEPGPPEDGDDGSGGSGGGSDPGGGPGSGGSAGGPAGTARATSRAGAGPSLGALVTITVPHTIWQGDTGPPGEVDGFGILDHDDTREAVAAAARNPATRWCVTLLNPDGTAAAHGCGTGPHRWPPGQGPPGPLTIRGLLGHLKITNLNQVIRGPCDHAQEEDRYRPSRKLQHVVKTRNATCTAPGCGRRAASCDLDHTDPHHHGGRTCECNLAPLCRHHHRGKQADGWRLEQPEPGILVWHTPAGRTYITTPTQYAI